MEALQPGTQLTYQLKYQTRGFLDLNQSVTSGGGGKNGARHDIVTTLTGMEIVTIVDRLSSGGFVCSITIANPVPGITIDGQPQAAAQQQIARDLTRTVYFHLNPSARLERTEFPKPYSTVSRNLIRAILSAQQFVLPPSRQVVPTWTTVEKSADGFFSAIYKSSSPTAGGTTVSKTISAPPKNVVPANKSDEGVSTSRNVPRGTVKYTIDPKQGTVTRVEGAIHEDVFVQERMDGANEVSVSLQLQSMNLASAASIKAAKDSFASAKASLSTAMNDEAAAGSEGELAVQRQVLGNDSAQSVQQALAALDKQTPSPEQNVRVYLKLKALLFLQPRQARIFGETLATIPLDKPSAGLIGEALATVGSVDTQEALCGAIEKRKGDVDAVSFLVPSLGTIAQPAVRTVTFLEDLSKSSPFPQARAASLLALGSAARNLAKSAPGRSDRIVETLLKSSTPDTDKVILILALGNSRAAKARTFVMAQKNDSAPMVRRAVATALSAFQSVESDGTLGSMLKSDEDAPVRAAAAQSLQTRAGLPPVRKALLDAAQKDQAENVRIASLLALVSLLEKDRQVRETVQAISTSDASPSVREQAKKLLEQPRDANSSTAPAR